MPRLGAVGLRRYSRRDRIPIAYQRRTRGLDHCVDPDAPKGGEIRLFLPAPRKPSQNLADRRCQCQSGFTGVPTQPLIDYRRANSSEGSGLHTLERHAHPMGGLVRALFSASPSHRGDAAMVARSFRVQSPRGLSVSTRILPCQCRRSLPGFTCYRQSCRKAHLSRGGCRTSLEEFIEVVDRIWPESKVVNLITPHVSRIHCLPPPHRRGCRFRSPCTPDNHPLTARKSETEPNDPACFALHPNAKIQASIRAALVPEDHPSAPADTTPS